MPPGGGRGDAPPTSTSTQPPSSPFRSSAAAVELQPLHEGGLTSSTGGFGSLQVLDGRDVLADARGSGGVSGSGGPGALPGSPMAAPGGLWARLIPHPVWRVAARNLVLICIW